MQFGFICTVMAAAIGYSLLTSGALVPVKPEKGSFPGGSYVYKFTNRDYAASFGLGRSISQQLINTQLELGQPTSKHYELEEDIYHVYLDDPSKRGGRRLRFMSGFLTSSKKDDRISMLMATNDDTKRTEFTEDEYHELSAREVFNLLPYQTAQLPSVDALVLQFPYTGGIASIMVQTIKVIPKMIELVEKEGEKKTTTTRKGKKKNPAIVISSCSKTDQMCTHYAPLVDGEKFLLGRPDTESYNDALGPEQMLNWHGMQKTLSDGAEKIGNFVMFWKKDTESKDKKTEL
eukprot:scaffold26401_cov113-Cylindrotheca_fusiformis.AAC.4